MKLTLTLSSLEKFAESTAEAVQSVLGPLEEDELDAAVQIHGHNVLRLCHWWFKRPDEITVEVDTEAKICRVVR